jgi:hypothetical protein
MTAQRGQLLSTSATVRRRLAGLAGDPDFVSSVLLQVELARAEIRAERRAAAQPPRNRRVTAA